MPIKTICDAIRQSHHRKKLLPHDIEVRVPDGKGGFDEPRTVRHVTVQLTQNTCNDEHRSADAGSGIEDVYDFPPSAKECACPIVIANETYERTDLLDDCEYGTVKLEVIAVRETNDEAMTAISSVIYALHQADWERCDNGNIDIREMTVDGMPKTKGCDTSGMHILSTSLSAKVRLW